MKRIKIISLKAIVTILIISGCGTGKKDETKNSQSGGPKGPMPVSGIVLIPEKLDNTVRTTGSILAYDDVELHAEAAGRIIKINFNEGSHVSKGDLLLKINDEDLQAQLRKNELQKKLIQQQLDRQKQLLKIQATSQEEYDIVANQLGSLNADKDVITASIRKTEIRAPFDGVIGLRYVSEGSYVSQSTRIASLQNISPVKIDFSVPEKYAEQVHKGDTINFSSAQSNEKYKGTVYAIEPRIDASTRTLQIRALCDNKTGKILPGSFASIDLRLNENKEALLVPTQAVIPVLKGQTIYVSKDGVAQSIPVKIGIRTADKIQITEGLAAGDTVLVSGIMSLKPNTPVKVMIK